VSIFYIESSALLKRYRTEKGTDLIDELFEGKLESEIFTTSYFTILEITSVVTRLFKASEISRLSYQRILGDLAQKLKQQIILQPVSDYILSEAINLIIDSTLRAPDSIQLATILTIRSIVPDQPVFFLCADVKLNAACKFSGINILDPEEVDSLKILRLYRSGL
jgi:uncharacterized protein